MDLKHLKENPQSLIGKPGKFQVKNSIWEIFFEELLRFLVILESVEKSEGFEDSNRKPGVLFSNEIAWNHFRNNVKLS